MCLAQGYNTVTPVRLEPAALSVASQTPYHLATVLPISGCKCLIVYRYARMCVYDNSSGLSRDVFIPLLTVNTEEKHYVNNLPE